MKRVRDEVDVDLGDLPHVGLGDSATGHQHARHRRRLLANAEIDGDDQTKMHRIDAYRLYQRHDHRDDEDDRRRRVQEKPEN